MLRFAPGGVSNRIVHLRYLRNLWMPEPDSSADVADFADGIAECCGSHLAAFQIVLSICAICVICGCLSRIQPQMSQISQMALLNAAVRTWRRFKSYCPSALSA